MIESHLGSAQRNSNAKAMREQTLDRKNNNNTCSVLFCAPFTSIT